MNEDMSRRGTLSLLGAALGLALSALVPSKVEAQTAAPAEPAAPAESGGTAGMKRASQQPSHEDEAIPWTTS